MWWGEAACAYLARSTAVRARETRRFLNESVAELGSRTLCQSLRRDPFGTPLAEVVVGLALKALGAKRLDHEASTPTGKALDWKASFPDATVYVEVVSPVINADAQAELLRNEALIEVIQRELPSGWRAWVSNVPDLRAGDSKKPLRSALKRAFSGLPLDPSPDAHIRVNEDTATGPLELDLLPARPEGGPPIEIYPAVGYMDNAFLRIEDAVRDKRVQARGADHPVLLAITGALGTHLESYDIALFGRTVAHIAGGRQVATSFDPTGIFAKGSGEPTLAGALAFPEVGVAGSAEPILYLHPRAKAPLPAALGTIERRRLGTDGIETLPAERSVMSHIAWASGLPDAAASHDAKGSPI